MQSPLKKGMTTLLPYRTPQPSTHRSTWKELLPVWKVARDARRKGRATGDFGERGDVQGEIMLVFAAGTWYFTREVMR